MGNNRRFVKAQSAMEYLMTYGWAILIIAVVLGALFSLGVFSSGTLLGTSCIPAPGYLCSSPSIGTSGNLSLSSFGQSTGSTIYNIGIGCAATSSSTGLPGNSLALVYIAANGAATATAANGPATGALTLTSGQTVALSGLKCFGTTAAALTSGQAIGTSFAGSLWMNYTLSSGDPGSGNPMLTAKIATLTAKVS
ncbi:MAG: hypothetical protein M1286_00050 [Candidatus Marsarchaeota archaeon]|nr:hypothetical protein [Candidatus Marsarchaeota archaeon]